MPHIEIQINLKPKKIEVAKGNYLVSVFIEDEFAFTMDSYYNDYMSAVDAVRERLKGE